MSFTLDRTKPTPLYQQIAEWMHQQIVTGNWPEHYQIQAEISLAETLGVNRGTLRHAINHLIDEGLLVRIHGRGTFVASQAIEQPLAQSMVTFSEELIEQNIQYTTFVHDQRIMQPSVRITSLLSLPEGSDVFFLQRVRQVRDTPLILLKNYVSCANCQGIEHEDFEENRLFETLEFKYGMRIAWGRRTFEAQVANEEVAEALQIVINSPVMYVQQVAYLEDDRPIELSDLWIRGDNFRVSAVVDRSNIKLTHKYPLNGTESTHSP